MNRGDIVTNKGSGQSYVVIDDECGRIVAARIIEISNPMEWEQSAMPSPASGSELDDAELRIRQDIEEAIIQASDAVNDSTEWWNQEEKGPRLIETLIEMIVIAAKEYASKPKAK